jgi:hypothetical protein
MALYHPCWRCLGSHSFNFTLAVSSKSMTRTCSTFAAWVRLKSTSEKTGVYCRLSMNSATWKLLKAMPRTTTE